MKDISQVVASDVMHSPVICTHPDETLKKLESRLEDRHISGMPVVEDGVMVGIITQDDLVRVPAMLDAMSRYVASEMLSDGPLITGEDKDDDGVPDNLSFRGQLSNMKVGEAMARSVVTCAPDSPLAEVIGQMVEHHIHRVVVVDAGKPVGIISTLDVLASLTE